MSLLDRVRPTAPRKGGPPVTVSGPRSAALVVGGTAGLRAAGISLAVVLVPLLAAWATASNVTASWTQALRVTADGWLLAHHVAIDYPGGRLGLVPLALTLVPALAVYRSARRLALSPAASGRGADGSVAPGWLVEVLTGLVLAYAGVATVIALLARTADVHAVLWQAPIGPAVIALVAGAIALLRHLPGGEVLTAALLGRVPSRLRAAWRPARAAVLVLLAAALIVVLVALALGGSRVLALHRALDPGLPGGVLLVAGQAAYLPVLLAWGLSWLAGPGFALGTGTVVSTAQVHLGVLPVVPVLGAVPATALPPGARWGLLAVPVLAGAVTGWWSVRRSPHADRSLPGRLLQAVLASVLAAGLLTALLALSTGAIGPGRLSEVGPHPLVAASVLLAELAAGALVMAALAHLLTGRGDAPAEVDGPREPKIETETETQGSGSAAD